MKKSYEGLSVEKISFEKDSNVMMTSIPAGCFQIVANVVEEGAQICSNPEDTTSHMWFGNRPQGWD